MATTGRWATVSPEPVGCRLGEELQQRGRPLRRAFTSPGRAVRITYYLSSHAEGSS